MPPAGSWTPGELCCRWNFLRTQLVFIALTGDCSSPDITELPGVDKNGTLNSSSVQDSADIGLGSFSNMLPWFSIHCPAHQLNLCVVKACGIPDIRNATTVISERA